MCRWHRTLMRHILLAKSITAVSLAMLEAAFSALLIAATGFPHRRRASSFGTAAGAVNLAPVAGGADGDLHPAAVAGEHSAGDFHGRFPSRQRDIDRAWQYVEYSPCTRAQHGVGRGIGVNLVVLAGVVPVPFGGLFLPHPEPFCHPRDAPHGRFAAAPRRRWARGRGRVSSRPTGSFRHALCRTTAVRRASKTRLASNTQNRHGRCS